MSAKDYKAIAEILAGDLATSATAGERQKVIGISYSLADYFKRDNENFDRGRFYSAINFPAAEHYEK